MIKQCGEVFEANGKAEELLCDLLNIISKLEKHGVPNVKIVIEEYYNGAFDKLL